MKEYPPYENTELTNLHHNPKFSSGIVLYIAALINMFLPFNSLVQISSIMTNLTCHTKEDWMHWYFQISTYKF